jgi:hypothetical protein
LCNPGLSLVALVNGSLVGTIPSSVLARFQSPLMSTLDPRAVLALEDKCPYDPEVRFEWDSRKAAANLRAHGVSFAEAVTVLEGDFALTRDDPAAVDEARFVRWG